MRFGRRFTLPPNLQTDTPMTNCTFPTLSFRPGKPSDGLQAIWPHRHSGLLPGLPSGNWTAASGIASDELRNVPERVVLDSIP